MLNEEVINLLLENNITLVNDVDEIENLAEDQVVCFIGNDKLKEVKISNQKICIIEQSNQIIDEEFVVIDCNKIDSQQLDDFKSKEDLFQHIKDFEQNELFDFIKRNQRSISNYSILELLINNNVDVKLLKIKVVGLWKY